MASLVLLPGAAWAATVTVNTTSDAPSAGQCSLREAVQYADGTAEPSCGPGTATPPTTINLPAGTYTLTASGLAITAGTAVNGAGPAKTTISGGNAVQPITIAANVIASLTGVTVSGGVSGVPSTGCTGSGIFRSCPRENGNNGGGISNAGSLTLTNDVITGNTASNGTLPFSLLLLVCLNGNCPAQVGKTGGSGGNGGGIYNAGHLVVEQSTISHNVAGAGASGTNGVSGTGADVSDGQDGGDGGFGGFGGGIINAPTGSVTVDQSTITANAAGAGGNGGAGSSATDAAGPGGFAGDPEPGGSGGGIANEGTLVITSSTLSGNGTGGGGNGATGGSGTGGKSNGLGSPSEPGGSGGGVWTDTPTTTAELTNDTLTANTTAAGGTGGTGAGAGGVGGGLFDYLGLVQLSFVTVAGNTAAGNGGGLGANVSSISEANSIVASNKGTPALNCASTVGDGGHDLVFGDNSCPGTNANPRLGPLASYGGPTQTLALQTGSGAIGLVPLNACSVPTDQRGITRPQGARCDAGAYEFGPPLLTAPAATAGQTSAAISAAVNPNLKATKVLVRYGPTSGYGSSTSARDIGSGNTDTRISIPVNGLTRGRTYHAELVATNSDGTSTSGDLKFTTGISAVVSASSKAVTKGVTLKLTIACRGSAAGRCAGPITATSHLTRRGGKPVAVAAAVKPRPVRTLVVVASGRYAIAGGTTKTIRVTLNRTGRNLLKRFRRLPATLTVSGARPPTRRVVFTTAKAKTKPKRHRGH